MVNIIFCFFKRKVHERQAALMLGVIIFWFSACRPSSIVSSVSDEEWEVFSSTVFNYSLEYPRYWLTFEYLNGNRGVEEIIAEMGNPPLFQPSIAIYQQDPNTQNLMNATEFSKQRLEAISLSYELGNLETKYLEDGNELIVQQLTFSNGPTFQGYVVVLPREEGNLIFILQTLSLSYDEATEIVFERIINSISNVARDKNLAWGSVSKH